MKQFPIILLALAVGSCTITKRHYRPGYFVQWKHHHVPEKSHNETMIQLIPDTLIRTEQIENNLLEMNNELSIHGENLENQTQQENPEKTNVKPARKVRVSKTNPDRNLNQLRIKNRIAKNTAKNENPKDELYVRTKNSRVGLTILTLFSSGILAIGLSLLVLIYLDSMIAGTIIFLAPIYIGMLLVLNINNRKETRYKSVRMRKIVYHLIALATCCLAVGSVYLTLLFFGLL